MSKHGSRDHWTTVPEEHWGLAQEMRKAPTHAEHVLWQILRGKKLGVSFRRQHPLGPYITDFMCTELNLIIEVDGDVHEELSQQEHDEARSVYLSGRGLRVIRFANEAVLSELDRVVKDLEKIIAAAKEDLR